jgi:hypothetical protein
MFYKSFSGIKIEFITYFKVLFISNGRSSITGQLVEAIRRRGERIPMLNETFDILNKTSLMVEAGSKTAIEIDKMLTNITGNKAQLLLNLGTGGSYGQLRSVLKRLARSDSCSISANLPLIATVCLLTILSTRFWFNTNTF